MQTLGPIPTRYACRTMLFGVVLLSSLGADAQRHSQSPSYSHKHAATLLAVQGRLAKPLSLSSADFRALPRNSIEIAQSSGGPRRYEGVLLLDILRRAGARLGGQDNEEARTYIEAISGKGQHVVFSMAELDPAFAESNVLVADTVDGSPVSNAGLLLITATDKIPMRSVDHLIIINVRRLR